MEAPDGSRRRLTEHFDVELNRVAVDRDVFARTDRLFRMANVVDSWLEAAGMRKTFARAANAVASGSMSADAAMSDVVEPGYAAAIAHTRRRLERNMAIAERAAIASAIVGEGGEPVRALQDDLRLRTADLENRALVKSMMEAILAETARHDRLDARSRHAADVFVRGIAENERNPGMSRLQDRSAARSNVLVPARNLPDLTEREIADRLRGSTRLAEKRAEIENLSRLVFGNSQAVARSVDRINDARSGAAAGDDVREGRLGEMAGEGRSWLRGSNPRQSAQAHAPRLAAALADYGHAVDLERHQIVTQHREAQARQRVEIPALSQRPADVLRTEGQDQNRRLDGEPALRRELETITLAINRRLSPADKVDLKAANVARLSSSLDITQEQGVALRNVHEQTRALQERSIRQNRELSQRILARGIGSQT